MGKIGNEAKTAWENNLDVMPDESEIRLKEEVKQDAVALAAANKKAKAKLIKAKQERDLNEKQEKRRGLTDEGNKAYVV